MAGSPSGKRTSGSACAASSALLLASFHTPSTQISAGARLRAAAMATRSSRERKAKCILKLELVQPAGNGRPAKALS